MVFKNSKIDEYSNNPTYSLFFLYLFLIFFSIITIYFYVDNPFHLYDFLGNNIIFFSLIVIFLFVSSITYYNIYYDNDDIVFTSKNLFNIIFLFGAKLTYYFLLSFFIFYLLKKTFNYVQNSNNVTNTIINIIYVLLFLTILYVGFSILMKILYNKKNNYGLNDFFDLLKNIFIFIPCLIDDIYNYILKNELTKENLIYILFLIVFFVHLFIFYIIPQMYIYILLYDGKQLLNQPIYLNNSNFLITYKDLNKNITNKNIFRYISQKYYDFIDNLLNKDDDDNIESYINLNDPNLNYEINEIIKDIQDKIDPDNLEKLLNENPELMNSIEQLKTNPDFLKEQLLNWSPYKGEYIDKLNSIFNINNIITTNQPIKDIINTNLYINYKNDIQYNYNYCISCWVFIDNYDGNKPTTTSEKSIIKFGNKLNLLFNAYKKELTLKVKSCITDLLNNEINKQKCNTKIAFRTNNILYQKWNHILFNYDSGTLDIFINNKLVSSTPNISPLYIDDGIIVGDENGVEGAICNVMYFSNILNKSEINNLYSFFYAKNPPIIL